MIKHEGGVANLTEQDDSHWVRVKNCMLLVTHTETGVQVQVHAYSFGGLLYKTIDISFDELHEFFNAIHIMKKSKMI